jgi:hypothetical protein
MVFGTKLEEVEGSKAGRGGGMRRAANGVVECIYAKANKTCQPNLYE